jgi:hypothetical protein
MHLNYQGYPRVNANKIQYHFYKPEHKDPWVYIHRAVMEYCKVGCAIPEGYQVHHISAKSDYSPDNLAVLTKKQHELQQTYPGYYDLDSLQCYSMINIREIRAKASKLYPLVSFGSFLRMLD